MLNLRDLCATLAVRQAFPPDTASPSRLPRQPDAGGAMVQNPEFNDLVQKAVPDKATKLVVVR